MADVFSGRAQADLRRLIGLSFSPSELAELAESLGVRAEGDLAKEIVRQAPAHQLLTRLRELRPVAEWPDVAPSAPPPGAVTVMAAPAPEAVAAPPGELPIPAAPSPPGALPLPASPASPPGALPLPTGPAEERSADTERAAPKAPLPSALAPSAAAPVETKKGIDPRLFMVVGGLTLVAGIAAFAAGRIWRQSDKTEQRISIRNDGLSNRARLGVEKALMQVARTCEVGGKQDDASVFDKAFERCGKDVSKPKPAPPAAKPEKSVLDLPPEGSASAGPLPDESASAGPSATGPVAQAPVGPQQPRAPLAHPPQPPRGPRDPVPQAGGGACVSRCEASHRSCKATCGAEPQQASLYQSYQGCLAKCLTSASHCRVACGK